MVDLNAQPIVNRTLGASEKTTILEVFKCILMASLVVVFLLGSAWIRGDILAIQYQIETLTRTNSELREANDLLKAEFNTLAAPAEMERVAGELGLIGSNNESVLFMKGDEPMPTQRLVAQSQTMPGVLHE
jgi:cell division protein FtsL